MDRAFTNDQLYDLPSVDDVNYVPVHRAYYQYRLWVTTLWLVIMLTGILVCYWLRWLGIQYVAEYLVAGWMLLAIAALYITHRGYGILGYAIRQHDVVFREGWIYRSIVAAPYVRVQHCEISQGPIARWLSLHQIEVFTAGGSGSDVTIPGLDLDTANRLRTYIIHKAGVNEPS